MSNRLLAVVTGASSGVGAAFARRLAERGYDLLLVARREERLRDLAVELEALHRVSVEVLATDLATDFGRERLAGRIRTAPNFGLLVNNAGFGALGFFHETDLGAQEQMHRLHVLTTLALSHAALRNLASRELPAGRTGIINVSSMASFGPEPFHVGYGATKTWMSAFTEGLAVELAARGSSVRVQALCPGLTRSEFVGRLGMDQFGLDKAWEKIPQSFWMSADAVVQESLRGFDRGRIFVIPGWRYRLIARLSRILPASWRRALAILRARQMVRTKPVVEMRTARAS
jgi:short-subunit dehydrogenase